MPEEMEENDAEVSDHMSDIDDESESFIKDDDDKMADHMAMDGTGAVKKKYDPKDPSRPRRKKARRACFACQRAHLTCGDERPCKRCIKRGLAEGCQDGVRKKAKYLHDAPPEALRPVLGPNYNPNAVPTRPNGHRQNSSQSDNGMSATSGSNYLPQGNPASFPVYQNQAQVGVPEGLPFNPQASPVSPSFQGPSNVQAQMGSMMPGNPMDFNALFDPSNPALYNFDLEGLNFGSQYAGWEFGILNKMALGADTPSRENSISQTTTSEPNYGAVFGNGGNQPYENNPNMIGSEYSAMDPGHSMYTQGILQHGLPHAYAIAAGPTSLASPSTESTTSPQPGGPLSGSPNPAGFAGMPNVPGPVKLKPRQERAYPSILAKRQRDSASIYASVTEPYPYTAGFHNMVSVLRERLPLNKLLRIARALGEIRPSFISCTKDLTREDLIFMEKCFQRTLVEFDDFLQHCCAPTIVCRRSGEVAAVNKEFTALTGWTKDVLLGKEPNQNIYIRPSPNRSLDDNDSVSRSGATTPRGAAPKVENADGRPQPVFLAELLDDDSVVEFYRDFSQLAFEDSRGKVQRSGRLMKYRGPGDIDPKDMQSHKDQRGILSSRVTRIDGEHGISRIEKDGKVNCTYCWTIKRDVFDIPMMIIINFLPRYYLNQEPHQLAV